ncbi:MAG: hypothetical protein WCC48_10785 [Anaeromyxobacteraceae bacterium]
MEATAADPSAQIRAGGWRQGSIVCEEDLKAVGHANADIAVVLSQDCDVVQVIDQEPVVELLLGKRIDKPRPDLLNGRNPRLLDLVVQDGGGEGAAAFRVHERVFLDKRKLATLAPSKVSLSRESLHCLIGWIAKRYTRAAFPDAFNERLEQVEGRLARLVKSEASRVVTGIYLLLIQADEELLAQEDYRVVVWVAVADATLGDAASFEQAQAFEIRLKSILEACHGIKLEGLELKGESDISIADLRLLKRLDVDYRSLAPKPGGALPPPGV